MKTDQNQCANKRNNNFLIINAIIQQIIIIIHIVVVGRSVVESVRIAYLRKYYELISTWIWLMAHLIWLWILTLHVVKHNPTGVIPAPFFTMCYDFPDIVWLSLWCSIRRDAEWAFGSSIRCWMAIDALADDLVSDKEIHLPLSLSLYHYLSFFLFLSNSLFLSHSLFWKFQRFCEIPPGSPSGQCHPSHNSLISKKIDKTIVATQKPASQLKDRKQNINLIVELN